MLAPATAVLVVPGCDHHIGLRDLFPPAFVNLQMAQAVNLAFWSQWSRFIPCDACGPKCFLDPVYKHEVGFKNKRFWVANNLYRQPQNVYFQNQLHAYWRYPKTYWSTINYITGRQKTNQPPPTMQLSSLADHFKSLLHQPGLTNALPFGPDKEDALCTFTPVNSAEVRTLLKILVTDKASGPDRIRPKELKTAAAQISDSLSAFLNKSLASGQLPDEFKSGLLLPIFKSGKTDSQKAENYGEYPSPAFFQRCSKGLFIHSYVTISNLLARFQTLGMVFDATTHALISLSLQLTTGF